MSCKKSLRDGRCERGIEFDIRSGEIRVNRVCDDVIVASGRLEQTDEKTGWMHDIWTFPLPEERTLVGTKSESEKEHELEIARDLLAIAKKSGFERVCASPDVVHSDDVAKGVLGFELDLKNKQYCKELGEVDYRQPPESLVFMVKDVKYYQPTFTTTLRDVAGWEDPKTD